MRVLPFLVLCLFLISAPARAIEVVPGKDIVNITRAMKDAHYPEVVSAIDWIESGTALSTWSVDGDTFAALYFKKSRKIKTLKYLLSDERPKALRKDFNLRVVSFNTNSGTMVLKTQKPKG